MSCLTTFPALKTLGIAPLCPGKLASKASTSIRAPQDDEFLAIVNSAWDYIEKNAAILVMANSGYRLLEIPQENKENGISRR
jgi:hypothetical protein